MSRINVAVLFAALIYAGPLSAAELRSELAQCRGIESLAQRLQCYDRLVDALPEINVTSTVTAPARTPAQPQPARTPQATQSVAATPEPEKVEPEALFGKSSAEVTEAVTKRLEIESLDEISSPVTRIQISPSKEYVVYLENGQVWRQKDKAGKWRINVGETAIISKAAFGSFLMKSDARKKSVRAERLR